jgi:ribosome modulation factor
VKTRQTLRAYRAGYRAFLRGQNSEPVNLHDHEYVTAFRQGWQDARRERVEHGGRRNVQTR